MAEKKINHHVPSILSREKKEARSAHIQLPIHGLQSDFAQQQYLGSKALR